MEGKSHIRPERLLGSKEHRRREVLCNYSTARMCEQQPLAWLSRRNFHCEQQAAAQAAVQATGPAKQRGMQSILMACFQLEEEMLGKHPHLLLLATQCSSLPIIVTTA